MRVGVLLACFEMQGVQPQESQQQVNFVVEDGPPARDGIPANDSPRRAFFSAVVTLSMAVLGSSVLPIPYAMARTGVLACLLTMCLVGVANALTSSMLIDAAAYTGRESYETLAEWAGGRGWKVFTQASLILLLYGTMCGGLSLLSDVCSTVLATAATLWCEGGPDRCALGPDGAPASPWPWVSGRGLCLAAVALVLGPLCVQRHMRGLERAATAGLVIVVGLIALLGWRAGSEGFPALRSGELPLWAIKVDSHLPEAFSVIGYAFYMQPMMMPMLREMPEGAAGTTVMHSAVRVVLFGVALTVYGSMGLFGAALFGDATNGNILVNDVLPGAGPRLALYATMALYLCVGMTTTQFALDASVDALMLGDDPPFTWTRQVLKTVCLLGASSAVALSFPNESEKMFGVTGASAAAAVCYIIPVFVQLRLVAARRADAKAGIEQGLRAPLLRLSSGVPILTAYHDPHALGTALAGEKPVGWVRDVVVPLAVMLLGVGISALALYIALVQWLWPASQ